MQRRSILGPCLAWALATLFVWNVHAQPSSPTLRERAKRAVKGGASEQAALLEYVDGEASMEELVALYAEGDDEPGFAVVAAKVARLYAHAGDQAKAEEAAKAALKAGAGELVPGVEAALERITRRDAVKPGVVGVILPLKGKSRKFGEMVRDGIMLASRGAGATEWLIRDSEGDPERAVALVEELARAGAIAIIGPLGSQEAIPAAVRAQELGVPMLSLSRVEGVPAVGPWIHRSALTNAQQGRALAKYALEVMGTKAAGILRPDIPASDEVAAAFWEAFEKGSGEVVVHETYPQDQTTFTKQVKRLVAREDLNQLAEYREEARKIREAEKNSYKRRKALEKLASRFPPAVDFDALLVPEGVQTVGLLAPALAVEEIITNGCDEKVLESIKKTQKREEIRTVTLLGTSAWNSPDFITRGGRYVICSVFVDGFHAGSSREATRRFVEAFQEQHGRKPSLFEAQGHDAAAIVREVLAREKPQSREAMRVALGKVKKFQGAMGDTSFGPDRDAERPLFFLTAGKNGGIEELELPSNGESAAPAKGP